MEKGELFTKLFDPRMGQIVAVQIEVLEEIRTGTCDCGPCAKMRACLGAADSVMSGDGSDSA